jgi:hypothetical protein
MNNTTTRPSVIFVTRNASLVLKSHGRKTNGQLIITPEKEVVIGNQEVRDELVDKLKAIGTETIAKWFETRKDYVSDTTIVFTMNRERDGKTKNGEGRLSDARRLGRGLAHYTVSSDLRAAKKIGKADILSLTWDGPIPNVPFDDDKKPFVVYRMEYREGILTPMRYLKIDGKFSKIHATETEDVTALRVPVREQQIVLDKHGIAHLFEEGYSFVITSDFQGAFLQQFRLNSLLLQGDIEGWNQLRADISGRAEASKMAWLDKQGLEVL